MGVYTTEIASDKIPSDNPIHQRLLQAYFLALEHVEGDLLEIGCGEGRGIPVLLDHSRTYTGIDKIGEVIENLRSVYPDHNFLQTNLPPISGLQDNSFDSIVSFQVIEHIRQDREYLKEIYRLLRPGGKALLTTPNIKKTLTRNPWHIREYTAAQLKSLAAEIFDKVEMQGITGSARVMEYYELNRQSVRRITKYDVFNLQYKLPAALLRIPYDILNRLNRNKLKDTDDDLVKSITHEDYLLTDDADNALDLFCILQKN